MVSRFFIITFIQKSEFYSFIGSLNIIFRGNRYVLDYVKPICLPYEDDVDENYEEFEKDFLNLYCLDEPSEVNFLASFGHERFSQL